MGSKWRKGAEFPEQVSANLSILQREALTRFRITHSSGHLYEGEAIRLIVDAYLKQIGQLKENNTA